jgi:hypothetical protein
VFTPILARCYYFVGRLSEVAERNPDLLEKREAIASLYGRLKDVRWQTVPSVTQIREQIRNKELYFREMWPDPDEFTVLRSIQRHLEDVEAGASKDDESIQLALSNYLVPFLQRFIEDGEADDVANVWWTLDILTSIGREEPFLPQLAKIIGRTKSRSGRVHPREDILEVKMSHDVLVPLRTNCFVLTDSVSIYQQLLDRAFRESRNEYHQYLDELGKFIDELFPEILRADSANLYLLATKLEASQKYIEFCHLRTLLTFLSKPMINVREYAPIDGYVCEKDTGFYEQIQTVATSIEEFISLKVESKANLPILIVGPSSSGKTYLCARIAKHFDKKTLDLPITSLDLINEAMKPESEEMKPPFIVINEVDTELRKSPFPNLLDLIDYGSYMGKELRGDVIFFTASKYPRLDEFRDFLETNKTSRRWEKGIDVFTRSKRLEIPLKHIDSYVQRCLLTLAKISAKYPESDTIEVDIGVMLDFARTAREDVRHLPSLLEERTVFHNGVLRHRDDTKNTERSVSLVRTRNHS